MCQKNRKKSIPTIILIDNSPLQTRHKFNEKSIERGSNNIIVIPISRYSPELNIIDILWRKIKYEWLPFSAYDSFEKLEAEWDSVLSMIGKEYVVNFS